MPRRSKKAVTINDLKERQQKFVREYLERGGRPGSAADAAQAAGFSPNNRPASRVRATELLRDPNVLAVLRNELSKKLTAGAALGVNVLIELAENEDVPPNVRLQAACQLIDRGHMVPMSRSAHLHAKTSLTIEDLVTTADEREEEEREQIVSRRDSNIIDAEYEAPPGPQKGPSRQDDPTDIDCDDE